MRLSRLYAASVLGIASSLIFFLTAVVKLPVALYFPLSRKWSLTPIPGELSMDFYGRSLLALAGGFAAAALTLAAFRLQTLWNKRPSASPQSPGRGLALLTGYTFTALLLAAGVYAYELYGRTPVPEPLPAELLRAPAFPPGFPPRSADPVPVQAPPNQDQASPPPE